MLRVVELNQKLYARIEAWRRRPIIGDDAYAYLDGIWLKRPRKRWGGEVKSVAALAKAADVVRSCGRCG